MEFKTSPLDLEAGGKFIAVMGANDAKKMGIISDDRVMISTKEREIMGILNTAEDFPEGVLGVYRAIQSTLELEEGAPVEVVLADRPESLTFIREKIMGNKLTPQQIEMIVADVVEHHLSDIELSSFVTSLQIHGTSMEEMEALSRAMVKMGKSISFKKTPILDKHSIGGVPGDKTTLIVVPIIAAAGYTIPKSSSRAITSPAGTADRMEVLAPVNKRIDEIIEIVDKVGACIIWGGALDLAPADDLFIQVEYPLSIDPLLLPSILSKKKAMGSTHVVIDIPTGRGAKVHTLNEAQQLSFNFIEIGGRLDMQIKCAITEGGQPIGCAIGPRLEAREALYTLMGKGPHDLVDKATSLSGVLLEMMGDENGKETALKIIESGKAEAKMREIIEAQGGDPEVQPEDLSPGRWVDVEAERDGRVLWIDNRAIARIARATGAPSTQTAGLYLNAKLGDPVKKGEPLLRIYSNNNRNLKQAEAMIDGVEPVVVGDRIGEKMLIMKISEAKTPGPDRYILDR